jgi:hypothetical protein
MQLTTRQSFAVALWQQCELKQIGPYQLIDHASELLASLLSSSGEVECDRLRDKLMGGAGLS